MFRLCFDSGPSPSSSPVRYLPWIDWDPTWFCDPQSDHWKYRPGYQRTVVLSKLASRFIPLVPAMSLLGSMPFVRSPSQVQLLPSSKLLVVSRAISLCFVGELQAFSISTLQPAIFFAIRPPCTENPTAFWNHDEPRVHVAALEHEYQPKSEDDESHDDDRASLLESMCKGKYLTS